MDAPRERIDLVYTTGPTAELHKPRVLLGSVLMRWVHWRAGISSPCLLDYKLPCVPCGEQSEYAYLAAAILETAPVKAVVPEPASDVMVKRRWDALPEGDKATYRARAVAELPAACRNLETFIESRAILIFSPRQQAEATTAQAPCLIGPRIVQCVPEFAVTRMDLDDLRGKVVKISVDRKRVTIKVLPFTVEPPADFDPHATYMRRYGLHRLVKTAPLKLWKQA